jgi:hypothetical protein
MAFGFIRAKSSALTMCRVAYQPHVQRHDVAGFEKFCLATGGRVPSKGAGAARSNALPDIPTVDEFLPGYEATA